MVRPSEESHVTLCMSLLGKKVELMIIPLLIAKYISKVPFSFIVSLSLR